ncbi:DegT/DnrJ/EryC1/StrS family aminotransferase [Geomobilimonas luticola]|uniref:DegT/DnrJ/EryC1/StrS aminotransferase family protein n=1 Tax=Geomobilimonas luticola TaxID=1114878 RepID=A0ABS5SG79_9BACT|nr:DegT/DnrJ/EryC1/StrS aminotransferase family protein [Geomobilimonas luticola]MBT0653022.1 DegT/DnrJ/EryC1/StrS aminotransferase family protein [Geomobilimonas luticola]
MYKIPIYQPSLTGNEKNYVNECLDSTWISSKGRFITEFEDEFATYTGTRYASSVCNGTVALHLALVALGIGPGDEVIVPTLTYISSVNAIAYTGATPVFVDSLESTWQMDPDDVSRKISPNTRAIMVVHLYGHPCDMDPLVSIAKEHGLFMIEDCAEAFGSFYKGRHVGSFGDIATYSFYGNKTITTGEGGMVVTNDETLYDRVVHFKGQGLAKHRQYWHDVIGYNYRMNNISAAIGLAQLERADDLLAKKRQVAQWYAEGLAGVPVTFHREVGNVHHSYWMCSIMVDDPLMRDPLREALEREGVETRPVFYPVHTMPMYAQKFQRHPVAESIGWRGINLPSWPELRIGQIQEINSMIKTFVTKG